VLSARFSGCANACACMSISVLEWHSWWLGRWSGSSRSISNPNPVTVQVVPLPLQTCGANRFFDLEHSHNFLNQKKSKRNWSQKSPEERHNKPTPPQFVFGLL
jgi:hypothetical protein